MNQGLFESLTGQFLDATPVESVPQKLRRVVSIMDHLDRMFNTRQGSMSHLRDYGLPDVSDIYRRMPEGVDELRGAIKSTVERYEPRLENVRVVQREAEGGDIRLGFIISAQLRGGGGLVRFQTMFTSLGNSSIAPWRKTV
jgi:type VI secretion system protein